MNKNKQSFKHIICEICGKPSIAIVRTKFVCKYCFLVLQRDNHRKHRKQLEITTDLNITRNCATLDCGNEFDTVFTGHINKLYYCPECQKLEKC